MISSISYFASSTQKKKLLNYLIIVKLVYKLNYTLQFLPTIIISTFKPNSYAIKFDRI